MRSPTLALLTPFRALVSAAILAACSDGGHPTAVTPDPPVPTRLEITEESITVVVPATRSLTAVVRDQRGEVMAQVVTFTSRDPTTARVDGSSLAAVAPGETWVVATAGALTDSVPVVVRYDVLAGEARLRIRTSRGKDMVRGWQPRAVLLEPLSEEPEQFLMLLATPNLDTLTVIMLPELPGVGERALAPVPVQSLFEASDLTQVPEFAYFIGDDGDDETVYVARAGSRLVVDAVEPAAHWGGTGLVRARLVIRAAGYRAEYGPQGVVVTPTGDSVWIHGDVAEPYTWEPEGRLSYSVEGGPAAGSAENVYAYFLSGYYGGPHVGAVRGSDDGVSVSVVMARPTAGTFTMQAQEGYGWTSLPTVELYSTRSGYYQGKVRSGSLTLTEARRPQGSTWGVVRGSVDAVLSFSGGYTSETWVAKVKITFHVPVEPEDGWTSASLRDLAPGASPLWAPLRLATGG